MFTFAVLTCNRLHYLKNCVNSVLEFVGLDDIQLLIIDNCSVEPGVTEFLAGLPKEIHIKRFGDRHSCELYRAMNYAIDFAEQSGSSYINFIQDDYQYLYKHPRMLEWVHDAFSAQKNAAQVQTNMVWKRKHHKIGRITPFTFDGVKWFCLQDKAMTDNGFTRLSVYKRTGKYPTNLGKPGTTSFKAEAWFAQKCRNLKYKRFMLGWPNMAMMMDCAYIRGNERRGRYFAPPNEYYLKPFGTDDIIEVHKQCEKNNLCFIEEMAKPDGWEPETLLKHSERDTREILHGV